MIHREAAANFTSVQPDTPPPVRTESLREAGESGDWWRDGLGWAGLGWASPRGGGGGTGREAKYGREKGALMPKRSRTGFCLGGETPAAAALPSLHFLNL